MKNIVSVVTLLLFFTSHINGQWYQQNSGTTSTILSVQFVDNNIGWAVGTESQGVHILFKTTNGGSDWFEQDTLLSSLEGSFTTFYFLNESTGWFIAYKFDETSNIYKTTDGGDNWNIQFTTPPFGAVLNDIQFTDSLIGYSAGWGQLSSGYIYKSTDGGNNWDLLLGPASAISTTSLIFINSDTGWVAGSNILKTTNGGNIWQEQINIEPYDFISVQFVNDEIGWASIDFPSGIFKTTDGGGTWYQQSAIELRSTFFVDTLYGWLVNGSNIYKTNNGGDDWILQSSISDQELWDIFFIDQNAGWAVGNNGAIIKTTNGGVTFLDDKNEVNIPQYFSLSQNYPNPFNPNTYIKYQIPELRFVTLKVYDILGNEVATLVNEVKHAGSYEVEFDGTRLTSGIYFYRIISGSYSDTKKLVLLK